MILEPQTLTAEQLADLFSRFESQDDNGEGVSFLELVTLIGFLTSTGAINLAASGYQVIAASLKEDDIMDDAGNIILSDEALAELLLDPEFQGLRAGPNF